MWNDKVKKKVYLWEMLLCVVIMFYYFLGDIGIALFGLCILLLLASTNFKFTFTNTDFFWLTFVIIQLSFGLLRNTNKAAVFSRAFLWLLCIMLKLLLQTKKDYEAYGFIRILFYFGLLNSVAIILEVINPSIIRNIRDFWGVPNMFEPERIVATRAGITSQAGVAGFNICLFECVCLAILLSANRNNRKRSICICLFGLISMILTGKRTFPIACILGVFIVFYMYYVIVLNKRQKMIEIILGVCITCVFILQLPIFSSFVERVLHGGVANRDIIYSRLGELFLEHPIFGAGMDEFYKVSLVGAHNEYLRVLAENGLFGFSFFIIALFLPVFNTLKTIKRHRLTMKILMNNGMPLWIIILFISLFWQILILIYAFTGNPLNTNEQIIAYFTFVGLEQASINKITYDSYELNVL